MNEERFLKAVNFPKDRNFPRTFPFNQLEKQLSTPQKKLLSDQIISRGIRILAVIKEENTNIPKYEDEHVRFDAINFLMIKVKDLKKAAQIYKVFAAIMPSALVILFLDEQKTKWIFASHEKKQGFNLAAKEVFEIAEQVSIEEVENTLSFEQLVKVNLKTFYESWLECMLTLELKLRYNVEKAVTLQDNILQKLVVMDEQITYCTAQAKKEKQMNLSIEWNMKAKKLKADKQALIEKEQQ